MSERVAQSLGRAEDFSTQGWRLEVENMEEQKRARKPDFSRCVQHIIAFGGLRSVDLVV